MFPPVTFNPAARVANPPRTAKPPLFIVCPPFTVTVERAIVEGRIGVPEGGGYTTPFTEDTKRPAVLTVKELRAFVMIGAEPMFVRPPLKVIVDAFRVEGMPPLPPGGYGAPFTELTLIFAVLIFTLLILLALTPPLKVARPFAVNVLVATAGPLNCAVPPLTTRPA